MEGEFNGNGKKTSGLVLEFLDDGDEDGEFSHVC
jgi:hypothetical protein